MEMVDETSCRLKFLSKIEENEKINTKHMFVQVAGLGTRISRSFIHIDSRSNTLNFCTTTLKSSMEIINILLESKKPLEKIRGINMVKDLKKSLRGLSNLSKTYSDDTNFLCKIEVLVEEINSFLNNIERAHPEAISLPIIPSSPKERKINESDEDN